MSKVYIIDDTTSKSLGFFCKGCNCDHSLTILSDIKTDPLWSWNGSFNRPSFKPSLIVFSSDPERRCHSIITNGMIEYLKDSFHSLKGQTVEMEEDN